MSAALAAAARFALAATPDAAEALGGGNIHDTYLVAAGARRYVLQRLSAALPVAPERLMANVARVCAHLAAKESDPRRRLTLVAAKDGAQFVTHQGRVWRAFDYVENTASRETARTSAEAEQAARAFGRFIKQLSDLAPADFDRVLPHFHDTPKRFLQFESALAADAAGRAAAAAAEIDFLAARRADMSLLTAMHARGAATERVIHNDTKINNVLFDAASGEGLCVVDLDTVMPGLVLYDFGDLVRSAVTGVAEDEPDLSRVVLREDVFEALARGFAAEAGDLLGAEERRQLTASVRLIALELGMRFLTDHMAGDVYFKTARAGHNLDRARVQLKIARLIEERRGELDARLAAIIPA